MHAILFCRVGLRYVFDTNVLVAGLRSNRGATRKLLSGVLEGSVLALASVPLMIEYEAVLTRPNHLEAMGLSTGEANVVLDAFAAVAEPVQLHFYWRPQIKRAS